MKICTKCNKTRSFLEFSKSKHRKDGLQVWCKVCMKVSNTSRRIERPDHVLSLDAKYRNKNKLSIKASSELYRSSNLEKVRSSRRASYAKNPNKEKLGSKLYKLRNPGKRKADVAKRRSARLQRTPSYADHDAIKEFYENCPEGFHVDHEIPLQGATVSGLHVRGNLQYLTAEENLRKNNKFYSTMEIF